MFDEGKEKLSEIESVITGLEPISNMHYILRENKNNLIALRAFPAHIQQGHQHLVHLL